MQLEPFGQAVLPARHDRFRDRLVGAHREQGSRFSSHDQLMDKGSRTGIEPLGVVDGDDQRPSTGPLVERGGDPSDQAQTVFGRGDGDVGKQVGERPEGDRR